MRNNEQLFKLFTKLDQYSNMFGVELPLPQIAVTGIQSAGKTTLIETYLGRPIGLACRDTGNRCPVRYTLIRDRKWTAEKPFFEIDGRIVDDTVAHEEIATHMRNIKQTHALQFSDVELRVTVRAANLPNLQIVDLPGLITNHHEGHRHADTINKIVANYLRNPSFYVIVVVKCTESVETMMEKTLLNDLATKEEYSGNAAPDWASRCIMVVNKCDSAFKDILTCDAANAFFAPVHKDRRYGGSHPIHYFVTMNPGSFDRENATFESCRDFYRALEANESNYFSRWVEGVKARPGKNGRSSVWDTKNNDVLGLHKAKEGIYQLWLRAFLDSYPAVLKTIEDRHLKCKNELLMVETKLETTPESLSKKFEAYVTKFVDQLKSVQTGKPLATTLMVNDVPLAHYDTISIHSYNDHDDDGSIPVFSPSKYGKTYQEDVMDNEEWGRKYKFYLSPEELESGEHLGVPNQGLGASLQTRQVAIGGVRRITKCMSYMMLAGITRLDADKDEVETFGKRITGDHYDAHDAVQNLARRCLMHNKSAIVWFCACAKNIYTRHTDIVHKYLARRGDMSFFGSREMMQVREDVSTAYMEALDELCLSPLRRSFEEECRKVAFYIPLDTVSTDIMAACMCPVDATLHDPEIFRTSSTGGAQTSGRRTPRMSSDAADQSANDFVIGATGLAEAIRETVEDSIPGGRIVVEAGGLVVNSLINGLSDLASSGTENEAPRRGGLYFNQRGGRSSTPPNSHVKEKVKILRECLGFLQTMRNAFNAADLVEGGLEEVLPQLPYDIEPSRDIAIARQLYFSS
ncbi:Dynamin- protein 5A, partial [Cladochytrium tenue]